jgi:hypothetical protein
VNPTPEAFRKLSGLRRSRALEILVEMDFQYLPLVSFDFLQFALISCRFLWFPLISFGFQWFPVIGFFRCPLASFDFL